MPAGGSPNRGGPLSCALRASGIRRGSQSLGQLAARGCRFLCYEEAIAQCSEPLYGLGWEPTSGLAQYGLGLASRQRVASPRIQSQPQPLVDAPLAAIAHDVDGAHLASVGHVSPTVGLQV